MRLFFIMMVCGLLVPYQAAQSAESSNPYADAYKPLELRAQVLPSDQAGPQIFKGTDNKEADYQRMLEQGYDLLGYASFEAGDVPMDKLKEHARAVKAHLVLVTTQRSGDVPASLKIEQLRKKARELNTDTVDLDMLDQSSVRYTYHASYWVRLVPPLLGLHVRSSTEQEEGLLVIAVIQGSPAENAGLQMQDVILQIGDVVLDEPQKLAQAARRYAGQTVDVTYKRGGEIIKNRVHLNPAH